MKKAKKSAEGARLPPACREAWQGRDGQGSAKPKKPWSGRFKEDISRSVEKFTQSISFDKKLYKYDIEGSLAYAKVLKNIDILNNNEYKKIAGELKNILLDIENGRVEFSPELEDIHMNIEALLISRVGEMGKKIHTGRSRNEQVVTDLRMYLKAEIKQVLELIKKLQKVILDLADKNSDVIMPGFTHLQPAQPVLFAHHLLAYFEMLERDKSRFNEAYKRTDVLPLGSGALAGSGFPIDRVLLAKELKFSEVCANSMDAVSDRDFVVDFISAAAQTMLHLSRLSEEIILWACPELGFIEIRDTFATGSSMMPQKKNPDVAELVRAKSGRTFGHLLGILTVMKGLPLTYNRDFQEDKECTFDTVDTLEASLKIMAELLPNLQINKDKMQKAAGEAFSTATELTDYIVRKGMPFREAHKMAGGIVVFALAQNKTLKDLSILEFKRFFGKINDDIYEAIKPENSVRAKNVYGGTAPRRVKDALKEALSKIG